MFHRTRLGSVVVSEKFLEVMELRKRCDFLSVLLLVEQNIVLKGIEATEGASVAEADSLTDDQWGPPTTSRVREVTGASGLGRLHHCLPG